MYQKVYVKKRPGLDEFLRLLANDYEIVIYTASLAQYADPVIDEMDVERVIAKRLYREACAVDDEGCFYKDLSKIGRKAKDCVMVDDNPRNFRNQKR
jgi:carboxy-terminal domain RNA polymerase II polypeptide A small phosphatase